MSVSLSLVHLSHERYVGKRASEAFAVSPSQFTNVIHFSLIKYTLRDGSRRFFWEKSGHFTVCPLENWAHLQAKPPLL